MEVDLFRGAVKFILTTRAEGNFHPASDGFGQRMEKVLRSMKAKDCFSLRTGFTNIVLEDEDLTFNSYYQDLIWRNASQADAVFTNQRKRALAIHNADCPVGVLFDVYRHRLGFVHLGLANLYREFNSAEIYSDQSSLEMVFKEMGGDAQNIIFWFGGGAQKCCYGKNPQNENDQRLISRLIKRFGKDVCSEVVSSGPRMGFTAIDLHKIILKEAYRLKLNLELTIETVLCASCLGLERNIDCEPGHYWSNIRDRKNYRSRNAAIAMMA